MTALLALALVLHAAPQDSGGRDGNAVRALLPFRLLHDMTLTHEGIRGRRPFAAGLGRQLYELRAEVRLFLQAQRGEISLDHRLYIGQTAVGLQRRDQRAACRFQPGSGAGGSLPSNGS